MRAVVPGQVAWDNALTAWENGNRGAAVAHTGVMFGEALATVMTSGTYGASRQAVVCTVNSTAAKTAGQLGREGEAAVRAAYEIGDKAKLTINGRTRIPDGLTADALSEVKNVDRLSFTRQLRDYLDHAQSEGLRFDLYTRPNTTLSGPLQNAVDNGLINQLHIPR
ncbi:hypothetical protein FNU76_10105 [Chitinimonas arctica]|uniref:Tox-REase-7 domain-containing protein n=1 Tax=Chitinimonas arctica TaxID=2594795 RepID=A0A516SF86_9NEIS|nr:putative toxin [Chitinimonas arctica]QDQ26688.1 hypothetical protein FNU76_10105 [Chitinimonas arctica]